MQRSDLTRLAPRMWAKVDLTEWEADVNAHWWWTAATAGGSRRNPAGYGHLSAVIDGKSRNVYAHRFFYELLEAPIPAGLSIDHLCRVTICVNPDHLEAVTPSTNTRRSKLHPSRRYVPSKASLEKSADRLRRYGYTVIPPEGK